MSDTPRRPRVFRLDDEAVKVADPGSREVPRGPVVVVPEIDEIPDLPPPPRRKRGFGWGALFWSAAGGLVSLGLWLAAMRLVEDLTARAPWLGYVGIALLALAALAALVIIGRELHGLWTLRSIAKLRERAVEAIDGDDRAKAREVVEELVELSRTNPRTAKGRARLADSKSDIIDGRDLLGIAERALMAPLDAEAKQIVAAAARRVSLVTAVSPRAAIDMVFVLVTALSMMRRLARLYGGRPGALGLISLFKTVIGHLAVTGGMAIGDSLVQQVLGAGIAARLSAKLGEGVLNGILTARLGLAAIDVTRPMPHHALPAPLLRDLVADLVGRREEAEDKPQAT